jgi:hypothetical protein
MTGWVDFSRDLTRERAVIEAMTQTMACRGPDAAGSWIRRDVALGHRRLAVIDLVGGAQPMVVSTPSGDVAMVYTGEAYNFTELRRELVAKGHSFESSSDTPSGLRSMPETMHAERGLAAVVNSAESGATRLHLLSVPAWLLNLASHKPADFREDETAPLPTANVPCALTLLMKSEDAKGIMTVHGSMKLTPLGSAIRFFGSKTLSGDCAPGGKGALIRACAYWPSSGELLAVAGGSGDAGESFVVGARLLRPMLE